MVEDNPGDVRLAQEAFKMNKVRNSLVSVGDGVEALAYLHLKGKYENATRPDMIILDINIPKKNGLEVLQEIKEDENLKRIPVVILTTSGAEEDILKCYDLHANCFITKPVDLDQFLKVIRSIEGFWLEIVRLPVE
jgi:CheY-like chemotaxis protein